MLKLCCILLYSTNRKLQKTIHWVKYTLATSCPKLGTRTDKYIVEKQIKLRFTRHHGQPDPKVLLLRISLFGDVRPWRLAYRYECLGRGCYINLKQSLSSNPPEYGDSKLFTNSNFMLFCTASIQKKNQEKPQNLASIIAGLRMKSNYVVTSNLLKTKYKSQTLCSRQCVLVGFIPLLKRMTRSH